MNTPLASIPVMDGATRPVFLDVDGRQYVLDDEGRPVYGVWVDIDEPEIVVKRERDNGPCD
jgi:hypothetical protein